eukprot:5909374-Pleurochrysis_carterae.AAC.2
MRAARDVEMARRSELARSRLRGRGGEADLARSATHVSRPRAVQGVLALSRFDVASLNLIKAVACGTPTRMQAVAVLHLLRLHAQERALSVSALLVLGLRSARLRLDLQASCESVQ